MSVRPIRAAWIPFLLVFLVVVPACDATDPTADLFLLEQPLRVQQFAFPQGDRGSAQALAPMTITPTFEVQGRALREGTATTQSQSVSFMTQLEELGYNVRAVDRVNFPNFITLSLEAPSGGSLEILDQARIVFSADGLADVTITRTSFSGPEQSIFFSGSQFERYAVQPSFDVRLVLDARTDVVDEGIYRFAVTYEAQFEVYDNEPASGDVAFESELDVRSLLQFQGFDIGDARSARVIEVTGFDQGYDYSAVPGVENLAPLSERLDVARLRIGSPETGETAPLASLREFEEEPFGASGNTRSTSRAAVDIDVLSTIRRTGRLLLAGSLELNEAAAARGEVYRLGFEIEIAFELPVPEGPPGGQMRSETVTRTITGPIRISDLAAP